MSEKEVNPNPQGKLDKVINGMNIFDKIAFGMNVIALVVLFLMIVVSFIDVFMRYVVRNSIVGMKEYTEVMLFVLVGMCVAYTLAKGKHIVVTLVIDKMNEKMRAAVKLVSTLLTAVFLAILSYSSVSLAGMYVQSKTAHGAIMQIVMWPLVILVTAGFLIAFLISIKQVLQAVSEARKQNLGAAGFAGGYAVGAALLALFILLMTQTISLPSTVLCIGAVLFMFLLMFLGVPVGFTLWIIGIALVGNIRGLTAAMAQLSTLNLQVTTNYTWSVVAFFLLMGFLCFHAQFGKDIFRCLNMFLSKIRGGICVVTIGASACLAAVVGDNNAVVSTMTSIAYPEMKKSRYDNKLAMGTLAAGSCLGPLIPPSTGFITYSLLTGVSLGKLFSSGIIPGIILAAAFIITIMLLCKLDPSKAPKGEDHTWQEKVRSLPGAVPIIILFVFVIGGTMLGVFTATEAGAMGCVGALVIGLIMRRFNWKTIVDAFSDAGSMVGMIFTVIVGAKVFSSGLGWCNLSNLVSGFFENLNWGTLMTVGFILVIFFICGFFIDLLPLMFVGIPIVWNVVSGLGVDGVWFGCLLVMICNMGVITPPFATILFVLKGMVPEVELSDIFKGVIPFVIATVLVVVLLFFAPGIVLWLPNMVG